MDIITGTPTPIVAKIMWKANVIVVSILLRFTLSNSIFKFPLS
jgi:hypothetical protein